MKSEYSVVIIAGEEERNIRGCLESCRESDEIIVLCSSKSDHTLEIAKEFTPHVGYREFDTFSAQRQAALEMATKEWTFVLDTDERLTPALQTEIRDVIGSGGCNGFLVPRKGYFLGKWMEFGGWYPDFQLRLFRRSKAKLTERLVHEGYVVVGEIGKLQHPLEHYTDPNIFHHLKKNVEYSRLEALERRKNVKARDLVLHPLSAFLKRYIVLRGWKDGAHGLAAALIHAVYNLQQYLYMWELQLRDREDSSS